MDALQAMIGFLSDPSNWRGSTGIPFRVLEHLQYSVTAVVLALVPGIGFGMYIGHTRRFEFLTITVANMGRALPSFAILALAFPLALALEMGFSIWPTVIALFFLALPPILTNTYAGIKNVDADAVEAARGMGMDGAQILRGIEVPLAAPLIVAGIRTSAVQVVATATLAALVAGGGLGRLIVDGFAKGAGAGQPGRGELLTGALLVAALAVVTEVAFGAVERLVRPGTRRPAAGPAAEENATEAPERATPPRG